jgi:hypothetical protein
VCGGLEHITFGLLGVRVGRDDDDGRHTHSYVDSNFSTSPKRADNRRRSSQPLHTHFVGIATMPH